MNQPMNLARIVPPDPSKSGATPSQGTRVFLSDGSELQGVFRVELTADVGGLWRGVIHVYPQVGVMEGMEVEVREGRGSWWRSLLCRMAGAKVKVTGVRDGSHMWEDA